MLIPAFVATVVFLQVSPGATPTAATPAVAPGAPAAVSTLTVKGQKKSVADDNRVVCHREQVLGTLFPKEVCATKAQFAQRQREDREELERDTALRPYDITKGLPTPN